MQFVPGANMRQWLERQNPDWPEIIDLYLQAGDVVSGGKQDRTIQVDTVIPAKSGRQSIASFCVEQGRWTAGATTDAIGQEAAALEFKSAGVNAAAPELKMAIQGLRNQSEVWRNVEKENGKVAADAFLLVKDTGIGVKLFKVADSVLHQQHGVFDQFKVR